MRPFAAIGVSLALAFTGCAANEGTDAGSDNASASSLSGTITGTGASSMKVAQENWVSAFQQANTGVTINYSPEGSGAGREAFIGGGTDFAGSDRAFKDEENVAGKFGNCTADSIAYDLPLYISPIAVIFNVEGVDKLQLDAATTAGIFKGDIKKWNDPKIAKLNPDAKLPNANITAVHRSDDSGTTENFTDYLNKVAPSVWDKKADGEWQYKGGEAAKGTSGVVAAVQNGVNTIGYADASQAGSLKVAEIGEGGKYSGPTEEAAAKVVENSPQVEGRHEHDLALKLDRKAEGYPIVLVSYVMLCQDYKDDKKAELVKAYATYMASEEGQKKAQETAGAAPLSAALSEKVKASIDSVK
ncbi:phosphate ABC transporter substrate-binding protein PstS [Luteococcus sp. Sow4_B9]|uniref:phosphate ABC transporter substrate-binding protein PstS n=1 Tax=Luteococcus sp. Sow4_B9 TaxID=3438792 RepID=UPI003F947442